MGGGRPEIMTLHWDPSHTHVLKETLRQSATELDYPWGIKEGESTSDATTSIVAVVHLSATSCYYRHIGSIIKLGGSHDNPRSLEKWEYSAVMIGSGVHAISRDKLLSISSTDYTAIYIRNMGVVSPRGLNAADRERLLQLMHILAHHMKMSGVQLNQMVDEINEKIAMHNLKREADGPEESSATQSPD